MKWKTVKYLLACLLYGSVSAIVIGYIFDIQFLVGNGAFSLWLGFFLLVYVVSRGKCDWCGELRGKSRLKCDLCGYKLCSADCFYKHKEQKKCIF